MVSISDDAARLIRRLVSNSELPEPAGLRLGTDDATHALTMNLQADPRPDDMVVARAGASLYVSRLAAARLRDQTLHAQLQPRPAFFVD